MSNNPGQAQVVHLTGAQLAKLNATQLNHYYASLPPADRAAAQKRLSVYRGAENSAYMRSTFRKKVVCPQASGGALSQIFAAGQTLPFSIPSAQNAYNEGILVRITGSISNAAGTAAVYALTAGGKLQLIDNITVQLNGVQHRFRPYILKTLNMLQGEYQPAIPYAVVAGQSVASTNTYLNAGSGVAVGANTWDYEYYVPWNFLSPTDSRGLMPQMGGETPIQVFITCAASMVGNDPILNSQYAVSGTGQVMTPTLVVQVIAVYRDGTSYNRPARYPLDLRGQGTTQLLLDTPLTGMSAGIVYRQKFSIMGELHYVLLTAVDGNQAQTFAVNSNIAVLELDKDSAGSEIFWRLGISSGSNLSINEYFADIRNFNLQQDLDQGILPVIKGPVDGVANPGNLGGNQYLNTGLHGWSDAHYGIQYTAINGIANITPRVEAHVVLMNAAGLVHG